MSSRLFFLILDFDFPCLFSFYKLLSLLLIKDQRKKKISFLRLPDTLKVLIDKGRKLVKLDPKPSL